MFLCIYIHIYDHIIPRNATLIVRGVINVPLKALGFEHHLLEGAIIKHLPECIFSWEPKALLRDY